VKNLISFSSCEMFKTRKRLLSQINITLHLVSTTLIYIYMQCLRETHLYDTIHCIEPFAIFFKLCLGVCFSKKILYVIFTIIEFTSSQVSVQEISSVNKTYSLTFLSSCKDLKLLKTTFIYKKN